MKKCKHCNEMVTTPHECKVANRTIYDGDDGDFLTSAIIGYATNSGIIGGIVGGNMIGGMLGDMLNSD